MHEMPIAMETVAQVVEIADAHGAARVAEVELEIGAMRQVVPEAPDMAFVAASADTIADGAVLKMIEVPARATCNACSQSFEPDIDHSFLCPGCGQADVRIVTGQEIILKSVVCETEDEVST